MISHKLVEEVYEEIYNRNKKKGMASVVHSDDFIRFMSSSTGVAPAHVVKIIRILIESHMIFSIEIVAKDSVRSVPRVEGYVVAMLDIVRDLKNYFQDALMREYEKQFHRKEMVHRIVKELFPMLKSYNNTAIGQITNKAIMLEEYERLLEKNFLEYTDEWKKENLHKAMLNENLDIDQAKTRQGSEPRDDSEKNSRAVDSPQYVDFLSKSKSYPLNRILKIYGMKFFLQVKLRKCQFKYLEKLIKDRQINNRKDLLMLREMVDTVKNNISRHREQDNKIEDLYSLEKALIHRLYFSNRQ